MSQITTHILDTAKGKPAQGIFVELFFYKKKFIKIGTGKTNQDGRIKDLLEQDFKLKKGKYRLTFFVDEYLKGKGFFSEISIDFQINDLNSHYHVPLLLSPFAYSTYRGS